MAAEIAKLKEALKWALENGAHPSYNHNTFNDGGCGCCSSNVELPEHLKSTVYEVLGWT